MSDESGPITVWLCWDCHHHLANVAGDPQWTSNETCAECWDAGEECWHDDYSPRGFSTRWCDRCETTVAGSRHRYAHWPPSI